MGTRINYYLFGDNGILPMVLCSNSHHPDVDGEALFRKAVAKSFGATGLTRTLLNMTYPSDWSGHSAGDNVFWIGSSSGDCEKVLTVKWLSSQDEQGKITLNRVIEDHPAHGWSDKALVRLDEEDLSLLRDLWDMAKDKLINRTREDCKTAEDCRAASEKAAAVNFLFKRIETDLWFEKNSSSKGFPTLEDMLIKGYIR